LQSSSLKKSENGASSQLRGHQGVNATTLAEILTSRSAKLAWSRVNCPMADLGLLAKPTR
jgi:hypothetical protein